MKRDRAGGSRARLVFGAAALALLAGCAPLGTAVDRIGNRVADPPERRAYPPAVPAARGLMMADLHADPLLSLRDLSERKRYGHVDIPRLRDAGVGVQVFTTVTHMPTCNTTNCGRWPNLVGLKAFVSGWPPRTWSSYLARALYQAEKMRRLARHDRNLVLVRGPGDLRAAIRRFRTHRSIAAILGIEGAQALEGKPANVAVLYRAGFRLFGLTHFIDNHFAASRHGKRAVDHAKAGLTADGRQLIREMNRLGIVIDLAHASTDTIMDVLAISRRPVVVSHGGIAATCRSPRNLTDVEIAAIVRHRGVIGVGVWPQAVGPSRTCPLPPELGELRPALRAAHAAARAIRHVALVACGKAAEEDRWRGRRLGALPRRCFANIALGTDFDGFVKVGFDVTGLHLVLDVLAETYGLDRSRLRAIASGNAVRVLTAALTPLR